MTNKIEIAEDQLVIIDVFCLFHFDIYVENIAQKKQIKLLVFTFFALG